MAALRALFVGLVVAVSAAFAQECQGGKIFNECGSACPPTCEDPSPFICVADCEAGCFCPASNPIHLPGGSCGTISNCTATCPGDMIWSDCAPACKPTCSNPNPTCAQSCEKRCACPVDRPIEKGDGTCISLDQCKEIHECPANQRWSKCARPCTATCKNPKPKCANVCTRRCTCPPELPILSGNGTCIIKKDCGSSRPPTCGKIGNSRRCRSSGCRWTKQKRRCSSRKG